MPAIPRTKRAVGWWSESTDNGGGHYGTRQAGGWVAASCGRKFVPLLVGVTPFKGKAIPLDKPADDQHACPACLANHPPGA